MKRLTQLVETTYELEQVKKFQDVLENIKLLQEATQKQKEFSATLKKGVESALLLGQIKIDMDTILASLCLNLIKNNLTTVEELELSKDSLKLINDISLYENLRYDENKEDAEKLRSMFVSMSKDIRSLIIKLADIAITVKEQSFSEKTKELDHLHKEIKEIYAPLAARLGLNFIKSILQDANLRYLEPEVYNNLKNQLEKGHLKREIALNKTIKNLTKMLKEMNVSGNVYGRIKHFYSINNKLNGRANGSLSNIFDLVAVRVIVENLNECYAVLGGVHTHYTPVANLFKDYIAKPKANGYQSLHTTIYGENNEIIEVQIRTQQMHDFAEYGVAAHFLYKENAKVKGSSIDKKLTWIRHIIENADSLSVNDMIDELKTNDYSGEIFVQTPKGNIIELPVGSTPIDFAYNVHSEVGNKCVGAKVNGKMVPLTTTLNNGEVIEIITSQTAKGPSRDWLKFVKSEAARSKINAYFKKERKEDNIKRGKSILEQAAKAKNLALHKLLEEKYLKELFERYSFASLDDMYASLGHGGVTTNQILTKLVRIDDELNEDKKEDEIKLAPVNYQQEYKQDVIIIRGLNNILTRFAKCCTPIPGDEVIGYVSRGKGITIHRNNCKTLNQLETERLIRAEWGNIENATYHAEINLIVKNASGALAAVTNKIAELKINIIAVTSNQISNERSLINLVVNITEKQQLSDLMNKLKTLNSVYEVYRSNEAI